MPDWEQHSNLIIVSVIGGTILLSVIAYYVARTLKGNLKLKLAGKSFAAGQDIEGSLAVELKKDVYVDRLYVTLLGERLVRSRSSSGNKSSSWREFYRDEADVLLDEQLEAGFRKSYDFALDAPSTETLDAGFAKAVEGAGAVVQGIAKVASVMAGGEFGGRKRWTVLARLETKGVDLAAKRRIHVSLKSTG